MRLLIITAVEQESRALGSIAGATVVAGGIGRTNAACATTEAILRSGPYDAVINAGVAGALPRVVQAAAPPDIGEVLAASASVYAEEGLLGPAGFSDVRGLNLALGDFEGNAVPADPRLLSAASEIFRIGRIATVATCSGTDEQAAAVAARTGGLAEAMEGAAVVHAARRLGVPALEVRCVSNTTGDRHAQRWDLSKALSALGDAMHRLARILRT